MMQSPVFSHRVSWVILLIGVLWVWALGGGAAAADRQFSKKAAAKFAAQIVPALPPAAPGWKVSATEPGAEGMMMRGEKPYSPIVNRRYVALSGNSQFFLTVKYVTSAELDKVDREQRAAQKRPNVSKVMIHDAPVYVASASANEPSYSFYMRVGTFALYGGANGKGVSKPFIVAMLRALDVARLQALTKQLRK